MAVSREIAILTNQEDGLAGIVVGLPRSLDGASHRQTRHVLSFVETLRQYTTLPVHLQDERKARLDAAAAAVILQDFLDHQRGPRTRDPAFEGGDAT